MSKSLEIIVVVAITLAQQVLLASSSLNGAAPTTWSAKWTPNTTTIQMETQATVWLELTNIDTTRSNYAFQIRSEEPLLATVLHGNISASEINTITSSWSGNVTINAIFLGKTQVYVELIDLTASGGGRIEPNLDDVLQLTVVREIRIIDHIFTASVATLVSLLYINFGAALDLNVLRSLIVRPIAPLCGLVCQFILMPLFSYGLGMLIFPNAVEMQIGLFFTGVSPSGGASNIWSVILDGNINLSILMTAVGNLAAFVTMPLWIFTLGVRIFDRGNIVVPYGRIASFAISLIVPLAIGLSIQRWCPRATRLLVRLLKPISSALIVFIIVFATATNLYLFKLFSWQIVVAGFGLPAAGYCAGWLTGKLLRQRDADALTIAIESGIQNTGISIFLLRFSLPQPQADLTTVIPVAVAILTPLPLFGIYLYKRCNKKAIEGQKLTSDDEGVIRTEAQRIYNTSA